MNTKSRNQREGHFAGKFLRRFRRKEHCTPCRRYFLTGGMHENDWICTRSERRSDSLLLSQLRRGVLTQDQYDEEYPPF